MTASSGFLELRLGFTGTPACPDEYSRAATLECAGAGRLRIQSSLNAVQLQFGSGVGGIQWGNDETFYPVVGSIPRAFDAVRVKNLTAGKAAQVILTAYPEGA